MKYFLIVVLVLFSFIVGLQAAELPKFIALKGHRIVDDSVMHFVDTIAFSPDGKKVVTSGADLTIRIWDAESGKELLKWEAPGQSAAFSLDGKIIAVCGSRPSQAAYIRIWDVESGKELQRVPVYAGKAFFDSFPFAERSVAWNSGGSIQIWDVESGNVFCKIAGHIGRAFPVLSPDGRLIVTAGLESDTTVRVWDVESGRELKQLGERERSAIFAIFSPDSTKIATAEQDKIVHIWDVKSGKKLKRITVPFSDRQAVFSPDGKKIAAIGKTDRGDDCVQILDSESGQVQELKIPDTRSFYSSSRPPDILFPEHLPESFSNIGSVVFSHDGKKVGAVGDFGFAGIWVLE